MIKFNLYGGRKGWWRFRGQGMWACAPGENYDLVRREGEGGELAFGCTRRCDLFDKGLGTVGGREQLSWIIKTVAGQVLCQFKFV